jgi:hypothetical protein
VRLDSRLERRGQLRRFATGARNVDPLFQGAEGGAPPSGGK